MPQLGETVTEGTVSRWLKKPGDAVAKYEPLLEIETDKVASEIPSPFAGTLVKILAEEGATVPVGTAVCEIAEVGATAATPQPSAEPAGAARAAPVAAAPATDAAAVPASASNGVRYSPAVRKLAREHRLDLSAVSGTGRGGRVTAHDVLSQAQTAAPFGASPRTVDIKSTAPASGATLPTAGVRTTAPTAAPAADGDTVVRLTPMRKTIAERMVLSKTTIPHAWTMVEADVTNLVKWREREKEAFKKREGVNLTFLPLIVQAVCEAVKDSPAVNSTWAGDHVILRKHINVGIAVDVDEGLVVPVVRDADRLSLAGLAQTISELVEKARTRRLTLTDLSDGTITVNNTGALGSVASVPIINPPQAAIITMEAIVKRPWVVDEAIAIRSIMNLCLCMDHRVLDGAVASRFLQSVKRRLEAY